MDCQSVTLFLKTISRYSLISICLVTSSCGLEEGEIFEGGIFRQDQIILVGGIANNYSVSSFTISGTFEYELYSYNSGGSIPRGIDLFEDSLYVVALDGTDRLDLISQSGARETFVDDSNLNGAIYDVKVGPQGDIFVIESNVIERFNQNGDRVGGPYIGTTVGGCSLNATRSITFNRNGHLVAVGQGGGDQISVYDVSGASPVCINATNMGAAVNPNGVVAHSNGLLYIAGLDDQVWVANSDGSSPTVLWNPGTGILNNPFAIAEHPSGDLLVSSSGTDTIERITTGGSRVGSKPFIRQSSTLDVRDILIVEVE